jgi:hypothetical protein
MTVVISALTLAALLIGIAVSMLLAIAALLEILSSLFARGSEEDVDSPARATRPPPEGKPAARPRIRLTQ